MYKEILMNEILQIIKHMTPEEVIEFFDIKEILENASAKDLQEFYEELSNKYGKKNIEKWLL